MDAEGRTYDALDDENPSPTAVASNALHLHQAECKDAAKGCCHTAYEVESCVTLAYLVPGVPCREEVHDARKVAGLRIRSG